MSEDKTTVDPTQDDSQVEETAADTQGEATFEVVEKSAEELQAEVNQLKAQLEDANSRMLRTLADMDNLRRRVRKEQEDQAKYASLKVVEALLPALDNFERALSVDKETASVDAVLTGVNMVYRQMVQVFEQEGLAVIEAKGQPFDPHQHQAVMQAEDPNFESGVVVEELQKGYKFKDRTIRPAMVKVNQ
ncbi:nucleotide exchange factor GrpE [Brevibacillus dissolubilis]|uniref:nucleotide exchange factor GrpE n=1 Tax=Brevibacillus dissolubilis TaxID=1844116 RepID=UPI00111618AE|nr:nucleotide exchange factor GrpE [Brevibacillus dissolubilis]